MGSVHVFVVVMVEMLVYLDRVNSECGNDVSVKYPLDVTTIKGELIKSVTSCKALVRDFPDVCERKSVGATGGRCCKACGDETCLDKVSKYNPYIVKGFTYISCNQLISKYKVLCRKEGKKGGYCCRRCQNVDTSCIDDELAEFGEMSCKQYIKQDKCNCAIDDVKDICCKSCKKVDIKKCQCRDYLSSSKPFIIEVKDESNKVIRKETITKCRTILQYYADDCKHLGQDGQPCCKSCKGVDTKCGDMTGWQISVERGGKTCKNCDCRALRMKSVALMRYVCKNDLVSPKFPGIGALKACCLQCKRLGYK